MAKVNMVERANEDLRMRIEKMKSEHVKTVEELENRHTTSIANDRV